MSTKNLTKFNADKHLSVRILTNLEHYMQEKEQESRKLSETLYVSENKVNMMPAP